MSVIARNDILKEIENKRIIIRSREDITKLVQNCSVDVTLGNYFWRSKKVDFEVCPWTTPAINIYDGPFYETDKIRLSPGEFILAHTDEFIGGVERITTMMKARSSIGRHNLTICRCAGAGDIGYINRWTLEITNSSQNTILLPVGKRIGQIWFFYTSSSDFGYEGKYQNSNDIDEIVKEWTPYKMLPRLDLDKN